MEAVTRLRDYPSLGDKKRGKPTGLTLVECRHGRPRILESGRLFCRFCGYSYSPGSDPPPVKRLMPTPMADELFAGPPSLF